jgi:hypothetical protein
MPDYNNGKIYKLWSLEGDDIYIGSTVNSLAKRKSDHKTNYNNDRACSSKILFQKYDDVRIELIEQFSCKNKQQLNKREGHYIRTLDCVNKEIAGRTQKEWEDDNKEKIKEYHKEYCKKYYENNREKINEIKKKYRENNKEKIKEKDKEYSKEYRENNKEKINQKDRERYENNKDEISQKKREYLKNNKDKINQIRRERYAMKKNLVSVQSPVLSPEQSVE